MINLYYFIQINPIKIFINKKEVKMKMPWFTMRMILIIGFLISGTTFAQSNTTLVGQWANGPCYTVDVSGNTGYFGNGGNLEIVDISNPVNPIILGKAVTPSVVRGVAVSGSYAYIGNGSAGLRIIDVSNPTTPVEMGSVEIGDDARGIAVSGNYAYVAADQEGLRIIDVSNPNTPFEAGFFDTGGWAYDVAVNGNYAYVADGPGWLRIIDVTNPFPKVPETSSTF